MPELKIDFAQALAVWLMRFNGTEESFWHGLCPRRLNALCKVLLPQQRPQSLQNRDKPSAREFFLGGD